MPVSFIALVLAAALAIPSSQRPEESPSVPPLPPNTAVQEAPDLEAVARDLDAALHPEEKQPAQIIIPSIKVNSPVVEVGVNGAGEMDVPDGGTNNVGWYKYGTVPGTTGSAVMDAHVYAAFKKLKHVRVGDSIYVRSARGETLHFRVVSSKVYPLASVPMQVIFSDTSGAFLNLITCEGTYLRAAGTYSHRRVVYAELVE